MFLSEIFSDSSVNIIGDMRGLMIDVLTPLAANKVPYVTIQQVVDRLREVRSGVRVDRSLVMNILDPNKVELIKKIEGDRVYLNLPIPDEIEQKEDDAERNKDKIRKSANKQAQRNVTKAAADTKDVAVKARNSLKKVTTWDI